MTAPTARRKIIYLSGTRADFGLMQSTLLQLAQVADVSVVATGMHLDARYGHTVQAIQATGLRIAGEIAVDVHSRTPVSMSVALADTLRGLAPLLQHEQPDVLLLLGDRGEMLAGAMAALHLGLVCVHLHGGERSGTVDEPVRHAISKLAAYHFCATQGSRERLIRMGEAPERVFVTGAPGLQGLSPERLPPWAGVAPTLGFEPQQPFVLALFHPVVQQAAQAQAQTAQLLQALHTVGLPVLWLEPNADAGSLGVLQALDELGLPPGSRRLAHLERAHFAAAMRQCAVLVGNSSAGIIEAASLGTPVVNVGERQHLRERNANVTDVAPQASAITQALHAAIAHGPWPCENLYGDGHAPERIVELLCQLPLTRTLLEKTNTY